MKLNIIKIIIAMISSCIFITLILHINSGNYNTYNDFNYEDNKYEWAYDYIGIKKRTNEGDGIRIAILDTSSNYALKLLNESVSFLQFPEKIINNSELITHADEIVGIINKISPNAQITLCVVADKDGIVYEDALKRALEWIELRDFEIVNMSLTLSYYSNEIANLLYNLYLKNVTLVASAGNDGKNSLDFPSSLYFVMSVGSIDKNGKKWINSNYGKELKFSLPGTNINSQYSNKIYEGSSLSAAFLTGIVSQIRHDKSDINNVELELILIDMAGNEEHNIMTGFGTPKFKEET
ncbi:MAG: S8 family serine peptidase [Lachnospiraceae bacterium]|nr:S8 family serine peptidase [Lachnospiraceae bacterium]